MKKGNKGFTLIELLVVIAIIAILSTVVMAGLNSARQKGRDAKRLSDIKQFQTALELCYDVVGGYPGAAALGALPAGGTDCDYRVGAGNVTRFDTFLGTTPVNPTPGGATYQYCSSAVSTPALTDCAAPGAGTGASSYLITFTLEGSSGSLAAGAHLASPTGIR